MRAAVLGRPVGHSLSPHMHNAAFQACGIDARYEAVELTEDGLRTWSDSIRHPDTLGGGVMRATVASG